MASKSPKMDISVVQAMDFKMVLFVYENRIRNETANMFWWGQFMLQNPEIPLSEQELISRYATEIRPNLANYGLPKPILDYLSGRKSLSPRTRVQNDKNVEEFARLTLATSTPKREFFANNLDPAQAAAKSRYTRNMLQRIRNANDDQALAALYRELKENCSPAKLNSSAGESPKDDLRKRVLKRNAGIELVEGTSALVKRPKATTTRILSHLAEPQPSTSGLQRPKMG